MGKMPDPICPPLDIRGELKGGFSKRSNNLVTYPYKTAKSHKKLLKCKII